MWTGPLAADPGAVQTLQASFASRWPGPMKVARDPKTFLARALAVRALNSASSHCNLRGGSFTHPLFARRQGQRPYRAAAALLCAALVLIAVNLAWQVTAQHRLAQAQERIRTLAVDITGSPRLVPRGQEILISRRALDTQTRLMAPFLAAEKPMAEVLRAVLTIGRDEGLAIETLTLNGQTVVLHGLVPKWSQCERAVLRLKEHGTNVKAERKDTPSGEERLAFVISMGWSHEK
jgi:hypothetical protein